MENQLTIEHLSAYLPYRISVTRDGTTIPMTADSNDIGAHWISIGGILRMNNVGRQQWKPLLRPLSQLTETIEHNGERFVPIIEMAKKFHVNQSHIVTHYAEQRCSREFAMVHCCVENSDTRYLYYQIFLDTLRNKYQEIKYLQSLHFDTFGLIESGLAIPIPSIEQP